MAEFRRGVPAPRIGVEPEPFEYCRCDRPDNEAWSDLCKTCKCLVEPYQQDEDTYGPGWPD